MAANGRNVLVVGAGIIGLVSAFRLARAGHHVVLLDSAPAQGATRAAAGMIAPGAEIAPGELANYELQKGALASWREIASELEVITGETLTIFQTGTLLVGWDASDRRMIDQFAHVARGFDAPLEPLTRMASPAAFEAITPRITEGHLMRDDAWIDPDQIVRLLMEGLDSLGVRFVRADVERVGTTKHGVVAETASETLTADLGLLTTGARGLPEGAHSRAGNVVRPVRGVTVRVQGLDRSDQPMIRAFVRGRAFYMVSRPGGYCVLGATAEEKSENVLEVGELQRLLRDGLDIVPSLEVAHILDTRMGLRPASTDLEPFFETLALTGWAWSSGHYRHGVTLAPIAARQALEFVEAAS